MLKVYDEEFYNVLGLFFFLQPQNTSKNMWF